MNSRIETLAPPTQIARDESLKVVGKPVIRVDAEAKVTGQVQYTGDFALPNMLYGKLLLSNRPHARIIRIDTAKARALPGVGAVVTAEDAPQVRYGAYLHDRFIFAREVVRYFGEPVAAVAAIDPQTAEQAAGLIEVEYEDLPAVFEPQASLAPGAPLLHPKLESYSAIFPYIRRGNVCFEAWVGIGDVERGFAEADLVVEHTYNTQAMHQAPIETHGSIAGFDQSGRLTVWTGTQQLSVCHAELAKALDMPMSQVRVIPLWLGGGFGGKLKTTLEPIVALLALQAQRPVKLILSRREEFLATHSRAPCTIHLKTGVKHDGTLVAREAEIVVDAGGYSDHTIGVVAHAMSSAQGSYRIPNCTAHGLAVYTNNPDFGCMRGYGNIEMNFAAEVHMDDIASELGMDPFELRRKNLFHDGDQLIQSQVLDDVLVEECMNRALDLAGYSERAGSLPPNHGIGIANITKTSGLLASSAIVKVNEDATVSLVTSAVDIGTGTHTMLLQIAAETLGIPLDCITIASLDSDSGPFDVGSIASRTVVNSGNAVRLAAEDLRAKLIQVAADTLNCSIDEIAYEEGRAFLADDPDTGFDFDTLVSIATYAHKGPVTGTGSYNGDRPFETSPGEGFPETILPVVGYGTHLAEVEVDPETGQVQLVNYVAVHDVGQPINPQGVEAQIQGGVIQGAGFGLLEESIFKDGVAQNPSLATYLLPTALEVPSITTSTLGTGTANGPFGAKGIGEHVMVGAAPAIANAIHAATGVMVRDLPITAEKLYTALQQKLAGQNSSSAADEDRGQP
jgi:CO/xanthine dehydrogenase Mo-binding subunit